jgi:hypothetical protein
VCVLGVTFVKSLYETIAVCVPEPKDEQFQEPQLITKSFV